MSFLKTNYVDIVIDGKIYNSLNDFGLAIENTDYIGDPVPDDSNIVIVPGRTSPLDLTDHVFGEQIYKYRPISIKFGALHDPVDWDHMISLIRNIFDGRQAKLYFFTEHDWYWKGRIRIQEFDRKRALGTAR